MEGKPREIFSRGDELRAIGLDVPPLTRLFLALREQGLDLPADVLTLEEARAALKQWRQGGRENV